jgi:hypothetical protein
MKKEEEPYPIWTMIQEEEPYPIWTMTKAEDPYLTKLDNDRGVEIFMG